MTDSLKTASAFMFGGLSKPFQPYEESLEVSSQRRLSRSISQPAQSSQSHSSLVFSLSPNSHPDEEKGRKFRPTLSQPSLEVTIEPSPSSTFTSTATDLVDDADFDEMLDEWAADRLESGTNEEVEEDEEEEEDEFLASMAKLRATEEAERDRQDELWSEVISTAVTEAKGELELNEFGLTRIPTSILELNDLVILAEASSIPSNRSFDRSQSLPSLPVVPKESTTEIHHPRGLFRVATLRATETSRSPFLPTSTPASTQIHNIAVPIHLFLANNSITASSIAWTLFSLHNLTALSFRGNPLGTLPEGIGRLRNLVELNVANCGLEYLPSEVLLLEKLSTIVLAGNPLLSPPLPEASTPTSPVPPSLTKKYLTTPIRILFSVPSLRELASRTLLRPLSPSSPDRLISTLPIPSDEETPYLYPFRTSFPTSSLQSLKPAPFDPPGQLFDPESHVCRSKAHEGEEKEFVKWAVERTEWVSEGCLKNRGVWANGELEKRNSVGGTLRIPIRHRGCSKGCLKWLDQ